MIQSTIVQGKTNFISLTSRISTENYFLLIFIPLVTKRIAIKDQARPLKKIITLFFPLTVNIMTS
ncbi:hypothetical protein MCP_1706 [Methanocella paludicola SANAE]|uniref:Uncharacterized protein n=2 Tax=Methanocella TaxID=570266 RepID=D1YZA6_METPS|nr:hypothetical protein MCP_1706 [Methanocella paludicola SANAE]